jgi:coenzyme Q-binding protein COQ10
MSTYKERCHLRYSAEQLFDLVADVEKYPEFVPSVTAINVRRREGNKVWLDMLVGSGALARRFSSVGVLDRPHRIEIRSDDPLFERYEQRWSFAPGAAGSTTVEFQVDFAFRSRLLQLTMGAFLRGAAGTMVRAFKRRALQIYGTP